MSDSERGPLTPNSGGIRGAMYESVVLRQAACVPQLWSPQNWGLGGLFLS